MPALELRPLTDDDLPVLSDLLTSTHPEQAQSLAQLKERQAFLQTLGEHHTWTLGWEGDTLVGAVETAGDHNHIGSGLYFLNLRVHSGWQDSDLVGRLFRHGVKTLKHRQPRGLRTRVREHWPELRVYKEQGFVELERSWHSVLDLTTFDPEAFVARAQRARTAGFRVAPLTELGWLGWDEHEEPEGSVLHRFYTLVVSLLAAVPFAEPVKPWPFRRWQGVMRQRGMKPEHAWVALAPDGRWIGLTELHPPDRAVPGLAHQGLTGVVDDWRGQGVAWALKLAATERGKAQGWQQLATVNHTVNQEMLGINAAMGFTREPAQWVLGRSWSDLD